MFTGIIEEIVISLTMQVPSVVEHLITAEPVVTARTLPLPSTAITSGSEDSHISFLLYASVGKTSVFIVWMEFVRITVSTSSIRTEDTAFPTITLHVAGV